MTRSDDVLGFKPPNVPASALTEPVVAEHPEIRFEGFGPPAFEILERLRENPHIEQYRTEKENIRRHITGPFRHYRDDLVVNWVLPSGLGLETKRNVFSRLLKNDYGGGGCHHHLWLSFYRPERTRITDIQLAHSLSPSGMRIAVYAGRQAKDAFDRAMRRVSAEPERFRDLLNPLLQNKVYTFAHHIGSGHSAKRVHVVGTVSKVPESVGKAGGVAVFRTIPMSDVLARGASLIETALASISELWPIYRFLLS